MSDKEKFKDDEAYYSDKSYMSNSAFKLLRQSPTKFHLWREGKWEYPTTSFFDIGTSLHALFLENKDITIKWDGTRRGNAYKEFCAENTDKIILPNKDYDTVHYMFDKLSKVDEVSQLMGIDFEPEVPETGELITDNGNKIPVKGKADAIVFDGVSHYIVDLKTTAKSLEDFRRSARFMLYNQQAYLYKTLFGMEDFYFLVVEKEFPYEVGIFKASEEFLHWGKKELETSINIYEKLFLNGAFRPFSAITGEL